jgi:hypothetical protein
MYFTSTTFVLNAVHLFLNTTEGSHHVFILSCIVYNAITWMSYWCWSRPLHHVVETDCCRHLSWVTRLYTVHDMYSTKTEDIRNFNWIHLDFPYNFQLQILEMTTTWHLYLVCIIEETGRKQKHMFKETLLLSLWKFWHKNLNRIKESIDSRNINPSSLSCVDSLVCLIVTACPVAYTWSILRDFLTAWISCQLKSIVSTLQTSLISAGVLGSGIFH